MSERIANGYTTKQREYLFSNLQDVYCDEEKTFTLSNHATERFLNFITHSLFSINMMYIMFIELYKPHYPDEKDNEYDFDIILTFWLSEFERNTKRIEFTMNRYSIISIDAIIDNLK